MKTLAIITLVTLVSGCATTTTARPLICEHYVREGWRVLLCVDAKDWYEKILPAYGPGPWNEDGTPRGREPEHRPRT